MVSFQDTTPLSSYSSLQWRVQDIKMRPTLGRRGLLKAPSHYRPIV